MLLCLELPMKLSELKEALEIIPDIPRVQTPALPSRIPGPPGGKGWSLLAHHLSRLSNEIQKEKEIEVGGGSRWVPPE